VVAALTPNTWTLKKAYPAVFGAVGLSAGVLPNATGQSIVYTLGGTDGEGGSGVGIQAYNVATNTWAGKCCARLYVFSTNGVGRIGSKQHIDGRLWAYDPAANTLTEKAHPPKNTADGVSGVIDGKFYVLPGTCSTDNYPNNPSYCQSEPIRTLFRYSPTTNTWSWKRPAPHYHAHGAGGVINGQFYVAGGDGVAALDRYDPLTDTWKTLAPLPTAGHARGAVLQGKLFVVVSRLRADLTTQLLAYAYNPATNTLTQKAAPRREHPDIVAITWGGKPYLLAVGGVQYNPSPTVNATELYTP
jgi:N-acetylneuraminic acid mutarotase